MLKLSICRNKSQQYEFCIKKELLKIILGKALNHFLAISGFESHKNKHEKKRDFSRLYLGY